LGIPNSSALFGQEGAAALLFKEIAQTIGAAMLHRKGRDGKIRTSKNLPELTGMSSIGMGECPPRKHEPNRSDHGWIQGSRATVNLELIDSSPNA